jgi:hypothetical protein
MHRVRHRVKFNLLLVLYIGTFCSVLNATVEEEPDLETLEKHGTVYVEPSDLATTSSDRQWSLRSYKERRRHWGVYIGAGISNYEPLNFNPNYSPNTYRKTYGQPWTGLIEGNLTVKRNFDAFGVGIEVSGGNLDNGRSNKAISDTNLNITEVRVGAALYFDMLFKEPYAVPYVSGGAYEMIYKESLGGNATGGTTQAAPYINGGVMMQLDWLDPSAAHASYRESRIQSSFAYLEARKYFASAKSKEPEDFSNDVSFDAGIRIEF